MNEGSAAAATGLVSGLPREIGGRGLAADEWTSESCPASLKTERALSVLLDAAPDAIVVVDRNGTISFTNRRTDEIFGYTQGELHGGQIDLLVPDRLRAHAADQRDDCLVVGARPPNGWGLELFGRRKDGSEFPIAIRLSVLRGENGDCHIAAFIRDLEERGWAEAEIERAEEEALAREAASRSVDAGRGGTSPLQPLWS